MSAVVDSSVIIDSFRGLAAAVRLMESHFRRGGLHSSVVVRIEVLAGMRSGEEEIIRQLFDEIVWHEVDAEIADEAGSLVRQWRAAYSGIDVPDLILAATAQTLGLPILTRNVRHFPMFSGLTAPY